MAIYSVSCHHEGRCYDHEHGHSTDAEREECFSKKHAVWDFEVLSDGERSFPCVVYESYDGRVVEVYTRTNVQFMSDVWGDQGVAVVLEDDGSYSEVAVWSDYGWHPSQKFERAEADATYEQQAAWLMLKDCRRLVKEHALDEARRARNKAALEAEAKKPAKGRKVKVVRGRKVPVGTVGRCFWVGQGGYGERVGIQTADGTTYWTAASNCEAV